MPRALAARLASVVPSATLAISAKAQAMRASGIDVISFGTGEPDFDTPENIRRAAHGAIDEGRTRYTPVSGIPELRSAVAAMSTRERGVEARAENVVITVGAKSALFNLALALFETGDEVVIPAPYWVSYPEQARIAGATPVFVPSTFESGWKITPDALRAALTPRTKAFVLCSPCNPTGAAYDAERLRAIADVLRDHDCWIVVDEIYSKLVYGGFEQRSLLAVAPDLGPRTVIIDGVSKTYAMTGWRIGWSIAPLELTAAMDKIQGQGVTSANAIAQFAALEALSASPIALASMVATFAERRDRLVNGLRALRGLCCTMPEGAFYAFPDVRGWVGRRARGQVLENDVDVAQWLLDSAHVAAVPGDAFGAPGHLRFSYAVSSSQIATALTRIERAMTELV